MEPTRAQAEAWLQQADQLAGDVRRWTGNDAHIVDVRRSQLHRMIGNHDPLIDSWRVDHLDLSGQRLLELLRNN